MDNILGTSWWN